MSDDLKARLAAAARSMSTADIANIGGQPGGSTSVSGACSVSTYSHWSGTSQPRSCSKAMAWLGRF